MDEPAKQILKQHLTYEIDMLEEALVFILCSNNPEYDLERRNDFIRNAVIEAFWTHARNLNEFFAQPCNVNSSGVASARDFTSDDKTRFRSTLDKSHTNRMNDQISHLRYERPATDDKKLGHDMARAYDVIFSAIQEFERRLTEEAKTYWKPRKRAPVLSFDRVVPSATNVITHTTTIANTTTGISRRSNFS
jgi:hypothetical protein